MAKSNAARKRAREPRGETPATRLEGVTGARGAGAPMALDRLIHERIRLAIVSALAVNPTLTFNELKQLLKTSDGNLSVHARKLEEAGYLHCSKQFEGRIPRTEFSLTASGRRALQRYLEHMEALIETTRSRGR